MGHKEAGGGLQPADEIKRPTEAGRLRLTRQLQPNRSQTYLQGAAGRLRLGVPPGPSCMCEKSMWKLRGGEF